MGILAGGQGSRLGGRDKGLLIREGETLVGRLTERLSDNVDEVIVNCRGNHWFYRHHADLLVCDAREAAGPCAGLSALLAANRSPLLWVLPVDAIGVKVTVLRTLQSALTENDTATYIADDNDRHQLVLLLRAECIKALSAYRTAGGSSVHGFLKAVDAKRVRLETRLSDIDSVEDLRL
jgi:molybdopterin-guanine dinucleotide biosynthesis protein A